MAGCPGSLADSASQSTVPVAWAHRWGRFRSGRAEPADRPIQPTALAHRGPRHAVFSIAVVGMPTPAASFGGPPPNLPSVRRSQQGVAFKPHGHTQSGRHFLRVVSAFGSAFLTQAFPPLAVPFAEPRPGPGAAPPPRPCPPRSFGRLAPSAAPRLPATAAIMRSAAGRRLRIAEWPSPHPENGHVCRAASLAAPEVPETHTGRSRAPRLWWPHTRPRAGLKRRN